MALVELVMSHELYASATLVFWVVDNGSLPLRPSCHQPEQVAVHGAQRLAVGHRR